MRRTFSGPRSAFTSVLSLVLLLLSANTNASELPSFSCDAPQSSSAPVFDVKAGCRCTAAGQAGVVYRASGNGNTDDSRAIQMCLLAAGQAAQASGQTARVVFPRGRYFVSGQWQTILPYHTDYPPHWVALSLPPEVHLEGAGASESIITTTKTTEDRPLNPLHPKRTGTYLFHAGFEKVAAEGGRPSYCAQPGVAEQNPLCTSLSPSSQQKGGTNNKIHGLGLIGDAAALLRDMDPETENLRGRSSALQVAAGNRLVLSDITVSGWYRGVLAFQTNGVEIRGSRFANHLKYAVGVFASANYTPPLFANVFTGNTFENTAAFLQAVHNTSRESPARNFNPWGGFSGLMMDTGNFNNVPDTEIRANTFRLIGRGLALEEPAKRVKIESNHFTENSIAIQLGGTDQYNGIVGNILVRGNIVERSFSGFQVVGCDFKDPRDANGNPTGRYCRSRNYGTLPAVEISDNRLEQFLGTSTRNATPQIAYFRPFGPGRKLAAIQISDSHSIKILRNQILDLQRTTQLYGIGVSTSMGNTPIASSPSPNCYGAVQRNRDIEIRDNQLGFSHWRRGRRGGRSAEKSVGLYLDNSEVTLSGIRRPPPRNFVPEENRAINSLVNGVEGFDAALSSPSFPVCSRSLQSTQSSCRRRFDSRLTWMASDRLEYLRSADPGEARNNWGYCADAALQAKDPSDEEFSPYPAL